MENFDEVPAITQSAPGKDPPGGTIHTLSKNVFINFVRVGVQALVALLLPAYLTHRLPVTIYAAWVLILQMAAYVSFLDFGIQSGVSKFVAEYDARDDRNGASRFASAGLIIMLMSGLLGCILTLVLASQVPRLFHGMPSSLYRDVRISIGLIGCSMSFGLVCSVFAAIFIGLQRYTIPVAILILNRLLFTALVLGAVALHGSLIVMSVCVALVNVGTGILQIAMGKNLATKVRVSFALANRNVLSQMAHYCFLLAIWNVGMLCVSGMDTTIVGHYAYRQTAYYSIAVLPTNFMLMIISSAIGPLLPAASALSTQRSISEMGDILVKVTRYSTVLLLLTGLPLVVGGLPILRLWVGNNYALQSITYLRILVVANIIRSLGAPYATMIVATGKMNAATVTAISEAVANLVCSTYLASRMGAIGVALGTLIGSFVSIAMHFLVSMHFTRDTFAISRIGLILHGILRPSMMLIPTVFFLPYWWASTLITLKPTVIFLWAVATLLLAWMGSLNKSDRGKLTQLMRSKLYPSHSS